MQRLLGIVSIFDLSNRNKNKNIFLNTLNRNKMKKLFILALVAIATGTIGFAKEPSFKVSNHFAASFSKAKNALWNTSNTFDKVTFVLDNEKVNAFYDKDGDLIGISKAIAFDKLPKSALEIITTRYTYPEFQLTDCIEFVTANNEKNYYISLNKKNETVTLEITQTGTVSVFDRKTRR
jgi:hypothetical protein